jgi:hypothetical protein
MKQKAKSHDVIDSFGTYLGWVEFNNVRRCWRAYGIVSQGILDMAARDLGSFKVRGEAIRAVHAFEPWRA